LKPFETFGVGAAELSFIAQLEFPGVLDDPAAREESSDPISYLQNVTNIDFS
jgi:hypothetical protein